MKTKKYCDNCNKEVKSDDKFCNYCEKKIKNNDSKSLIFSILILVATLLIPIIKYFIEIDIVYHLIYGNIDDFFIVVSETIMTSFIGLTFGFGIVLLINLFCKKSHFKFLANTKKLVLCGLISSILVIIAPAIYYFIDNLINYEYYEKIEILMYFIVDIVENCINNIYYTGLIIYFSIILLRMNKKKVNIKLANYILITTIIIHTLFKEYYNTVLTLLYFVVNILSILYFIKVLLGKRNFMNNKIFAISAIGVELIGIISLFEAVDYDYFTNTFVIIVCALSKILIVPYFYNYYELLKEEDKNV